jgi:hypothetical protein
MILGRTDQGLVTDPNGRGPGRVTGLGHLGEVYNWWKGRRGGHNFGHQDSAAFSDAINRAASTPVTPPAFQGAPVPHLDQMRQFRSEMEAPIRMRFERDPGESQFRRSSIRREVDKEFRDARWLSMVDIGAA